MNFNFDIDIDFDLGLLWMFLSAGNLSYGLGAMVGKAD
jgi:hypothetical protein